MTIAVIDLLGTSGYSEYDLPEDIAASPKLLFSQALPRLLFIPSEKEKKQNKGAYLLSKNNIIADDLISYSYIHKQKVASISKIILGIQFSLSEKNNDSSFEVLPDMNRPADSRKYGEFLQLYLKEVVRYISIIKRVNCIFSNPDTTVIVIPDWIEDINQDIILGIAQGIFTSPVLLWNSVAACIGALASYDGRDMDKSIKEGDSFHVNEMNRTYRSCAILPMSLHKGRLIPCHHIFWNTEEEGKKTIRNQFYPYYSLADSYHPFDDEFDIVRSRDGYIIMTQSTHVPHFRSASFGYVHGHNSIQLNHSGIITVGSRSMNIKNPVPLGAALFVQQKEAGLIPYFEESKALYMVTATPEEEIILKTLIPYTEKMPAGRINQQEEINGISLQKGAESIEFHLLFTTEKNSSILRRRKLRSLIQKLNVSDELRNTPREVPLKLIPTVFPGQGRAKVEIKVSESRDAEVLEPVFLNWDEMRTSSKTVNIIEDELPRSFPVDIPTVVCNDYKFRNAYHWIKKYVDGSASYSLLEFNKSNFIDKHAPGIDKLRRSSVFGSPKNNGVDYPKSQETVQYVTKLFKKLAYEYEHTGDAKILTQIAWTYHGEPFQPIVKKILREIEYASSHGDGVAPQKQTCCANLLIEDQDMIRYLRAFFERLKNPMQINGWCRAAYQVLMYNSSFLRVDIPNAITEQELIDGMKRLTIASLCNCNSEHILKNIDMTMYFLFKGRKYHKGFCRLSNSPLSPSDYRNNELFEYIKASLLSPIAAFAKVVIDLFLVQKEGLEISDTLAFRAYRALGGFPKPFTSFNLQDFDENQWTVINDWSCWADNGLTYWARLKEAGVSVPKIQRRGIEHFLNYYESFLNNCFSRYNLSGFTKANLYTNRPYTVWRIDIINILLGKGTLTIPLGDDD